MAARRAPAILYPVVRLWRFSFGNAALVPSCAGCRQSDGSPRVARQMAVVLRSAAKLPRGFPSRSYFGQARVTIMHDTHRVGARRPSSWWLLFWVMGLRPDRVVAVFAGLAPLAREVTILVPAGCFPLVGGPPGLRDRTSQASPGPCLRTGASNRSLCGGRT